jgi:hypothetical protein
VTLTIEEAKQFITDSKEAKEVFECIADDSWAELKKRRSTDVITDYRKQRRRKRYPGWWSIFKIRQPLILSRAGIPIGKDTTQDGTDNMGATAALILERLAVNLSKSFDFMDVLEDCRDEVLATSFTTARIYYEREVETQKVKEYIQPVMDANGEPEFFDADGKPIEPTDLKADDEGMFIEHSQVVDVEHEKICVEPVLYNMMHVDPECRRWRRAKRWACEDYYSVPEFKEVFGVQAYIEMGLEQKRSSATDKSKAKDKTIKVYEYWDGYEKKTYWFAEHSPDFITPKGYLVPEDYAEDMAEGESDDNGLYDLEQFHPFVKPMIINAPTDEFWPVPEYEQLCDIFEDIHTLFARMMSISKAIRARLLYDKNIPGLAAALSEARDADTFGVPNLSQALTAAGGQLDNAAQYINVSTLIQSLEIVSQQLEQRLNVIYRLTGTSDILQGMQQDNQRDRTLGESQMLEKYAQNQLAELQRKMQEFVRDVYQLMTEAALKNFNDASLDRYVMPQTMPDEHKQNYRGALGMLKDDTKRFRIELETDSTIAINEQYDKQMRIQLVDVATTALEKVASMAEGNPAIVALELHFLKHLVQGFRQSKMFQQEISQTIDNVIKGAEEAAKNAKPPFDAEEAKANLEMQRMQLDSQQAQADNSLKFYEIQSRERIEASRLQNEQVLKNLDAQLQQFKIQMELSKSQADLQLSYAQLSSGIAQAREEMAVKQQTLMVELQKIAGDQDISKYQLQLEEQFGTVDAMLKQRQQSIEESLGQLELSERIATEQRLQDEHQLNKAAAMVDMAATIKDSNAPEAAPEPTQPKRKRHFKMKKDAKGNLTSMEVKNEEG